MTDTEWLIWSFEHDAWWCPNERGYTEQIKLAGRYPRARAEQIVRAAQYGGEVNEAMVPAPSKAVPHHPSPFHDD